MNVFSRSSLCLAVVVLATGAHAQVNTDARTIFGTYAVTTTQNCLSAPEGGPGQSPFQVQTTTNGQTQVFSSAVNQPNSPPTLSLLSTVAHLTLVINPRTGMMTSSDVHVTRLDENRPGANPPNFPMVLQRTVRTFSANFNVDQATDTLLVGTRTEQGTTPDGTPATWTHQAGARLRTVDFGQTIFGAGSDTPEMIEEVIASPTPKYFAIVCDRTVRGQRISPRF